MFAEDASKDFSEDRRYHFYTGFCSVSVYLQNLRRRLLSSEKFSEVFTLWVFTLKPFSRDYHRLTLLKRGCANSVVGLESSLNQSYESRRPPDYSSNLYPPKTFAI